MFSSADCGGRDILIFCVSEMALEVSRPDSGISMFWIILFSTCVILKYTGKQLVASDPEDRKVSDTSRRRHTSLMRPSHSVCKERVCM